MSKPYNEEMWEAERKIALKEYLISSREADRRFFRKVTLFIIGGIIFTIFLCFFQDIIHYIREKDNIVTEKDEINLIIDTVDDLIRNGKITSNEKILMSDLYSGKYDIVLPNIYSHTKYKHQCIGYVIVEDGDINTEHYCEMYE